MLEEVDLTPSPRLLEVLGDIPYKPWQCLAELIDNAFDDFLDDPHRDPRDPPEVRVTLPKAAMAADGDALVCVADNGRGMSREELEKALKAGYSGNARYGHLGVFGMGFNIATARLGQITEIRTTRAGDSSWVVVEIDFKDLQRRESFRVGARREPKTDPSAHGTEVTVRRFRQETREALRRGNTIGSVREQLGNVYSYLLRDRNPIPGAPDTTFAGRGFGLWVNDIKVKPRLPCVWSATRSVSSRGSEIKAIEVINRELPPALACMDCGTWHRRDVERCLECESENLELRERQIVGWLGIQRYLHDSDYGIDFLRNGRKILISDKSFFTWENPDTGERIVEYPIEFPANYGRIVGEIHLDHVGVNYQKTDFERGSRDWATVVDVIRGDGPLGSGKARQRNYPENASSLARLYKGYRRNTPGLKELTPGNGKDPIHERTREWAANFRKGLAGYLTDEKWYEAAKRHDEIKTGVGESAPGGPADPGDLRGRTGLDDPPPAGAGSGGGPGAQASPPAPSPPETDEQRFARYRAAARQFLDLAGEVGVANLARRPVAVYDTTEALADDEGNRVPIVTRLGKGGLIEVYVHGAHDVFREFGRDPRDYAIMEIAATLRELARSQARISHVAANVTQQFKDQRVSDAALRDRADSLLREIRELMAPGVAKNPDELWAALPASHKQTAERNAARVDPRIDWRAATRDGSFVSYVDAPGVACLLRARPDLFLDSVVFRATWVTWGDDARTRQVERLTRLLETIGAFICNTDPKSRLELAMARLTLDMIDDEITRSE